MRITENTQEINTKLVNKSRIPGSFGFENKLGNNNIDPMDWYGRAEFPLHFCFRVSHSFLSMFI